MAGPTNASIRADGRRSGSPLYLQVAAQLRAEILAGRFPVGSNLPTVKQLAALHGVSQQTAREAVARLRNTGLVSTRRKGGTRVELQHLDPSGHVQDAIEQLLNYGDQVRLKIDAKEWFVARREMAELLNCPPGASWMLARGHRRLGDDPRPRVHVEAYINPAYPEVFETITPRTKVIFRKFEEHYGIQVGEFRQELRTVAVTGMAARTLGLEEGALAMRYVHRFFDPFGEALQVSINIHPIDENATKLVKRPTLLPRLSVED